MIANGVNCPMTFRHPVIPVLIILAFCSCSRLPKPDFSYIPEENPESGDSVRFINLTKNGTDYEWEFGDGEFAYMENPIHIFKEAAIFEIKLTAINDAGSNLIREPVTINEPTVLSLLVQDSTKTQSIPLADVWVYEDETARDNLEPPLYAEITNSEGRCTFHNLEPIAYHIWISKQETGGSWTYRGFTYALDRNKVNNYIVPCQWSMD